MPMNGRAIAGDTALLVTPRASVHAVAQPSTADEKIIMQVVGKQPESRKTRPSRALLLVDDPRAGRSDIESPQSYVRPAGGGLLDSWFGGQKSKTAKKEHEDGRKATALPPPDSAEVDWNGVPFHQPKPSSEPASSASAAPLRDAQRGPSSVPSSAAHLRRPPASSPSNNRSISGQPVSSRPTSSSDRTGSGRLSGRPLEEVIDAPLVATQQPTLSTPNRAAASELSSVNSSRRSDRRAVDALLPDAVLDSPAKVAGGVAQTPTAPIAMTERLPAPSVSRRELLPVDPPATEISSTLSAEVPPQSIPQVPSPADVIPMLPPSPAPLAEVAQSDIPAVSKPKLPTATLEDNWKSVGSGVRQLVPAPVSTKSDSLTPTDLVDKIPTVPVGTGAVVKDATPSGPSPASERALRGQLFADAELTAENGEADGKAASGVSATAANRQQVAARSQPLSSQLAASELPGVRVVTEGPSEIMIHELTQYEVRVENRGSTDATGIAIRSSLPVWAQVQGHNASIGSIKTINQGGQPQLVWTIDKMPAGVVERLFIRVKAVKSGTFDAATDWTMMPQKHVAKITVREPKLAIVIDGPDEIVYGRSEKYRVRVTNPGDGDASNVVFTLSPDSKTPQSQNIGSIPAGKEAEFEVELTARERGELKIGGTAVADRDVKGTANKSIRIAAADVEAELTGPPLKYQNTEAKYHLHVTNTGKANCESIAAELRLPAGVKYVSGIQQALVQGDRVTWNIDALQPGAVREYDIVCKLERTGEMLLTFNCSGSAAGRANVSIETQVEAIADLVLSISDPVAPAPVDTEVSYEMTILNRGSKAAEDVRVVAQFSNGIEPIRIEGHTGEVVTGQVLFNPIARIEPGSSIRLKVTAKADRAGDHRFRTEVREGETSLVAEEATMFMNAPAERISRRSTDQ